VVRAFALNFAGHLEQAAAEGIFGVAFGSGLQKGITQFE
jgi:hypothetical protein